MENAIIEKNKKFASCNANEILKESSTKVQKGKDHEEEEK